MALVATNKTEQSQRNSRTRDVIAHARARANTNPQFVTGRCRTQQLSNNVPLCRENNSARTHTG
jgi:hypothetical protein